MAIYTTAMTAAAVIFKIGATTIKNEEKKTFYLYGEEHMCGGDIFYANYVIERTHDFWLSTFKPIYVCTLVLSHSLAHLNIYTQELFLCKFLIS